jgi:hypothetical protein
MAERIEVVSLLAPSEVLDRLARYGKEWRESKIPPSARGQFFGCRITVRGHEFELQLEPQGNRGVFIWRGQVVADSATGGSRIHARAKLKWWYAIVSVIAVVFFIGWWDGPQLVGAERSVDGAVFAIGGTCLMLIVAWAITAGRAGEQGHACKAIFAQILSNSADVRPGAT